jgi:hypothetical protein
MMFVFESHGEKGPKARKDHEKYCMKMKNVILSGVSGFASHVGLVQGYPGVFL